MSEKLAVVSGKGGTGKTLLSAVFGKALAEEGKKTLLIDFNFCLRGLDFYLGAENLVFYTVLDVLKGSASLEDALIWKGDHFAYLSASWTAEPTQEEYRSLESLLAQAEELFDCILFDCSSGIGRPVEKACRLVDQVIIVTDGTFSGVRCADRVRSLFSDLLNVRPWLLLNRIEEANSDFLVSREELSDLIPVDVLGMIPENRLLRSRCESGDLFYWEWREEEGFSFEKIESILSKLGLLKTETGEEEEYEGGVLTLDDLFPEEDRKEEQEKEEPAAEDLPSGGEAIPEPAENKSFLQRLKEVLFG